MYVASFFSLSVRTSGVPTLAVPVTVTEALAGLTVSVMVKVAFGSCHLRVG